jgi:hypothetical protein
VFGTEVFYYPLRAKVEEELSAHKAWYLQHVYAGSEEAHASDLADARTAAAWSPTNHLYAIANVLRRPVALFASLEDMRMRASRLGTTTYLPARHPAAECVTNPLMLAWQSGDAMHYVPLCRAANGAPAIPEACRPPGSTPAGFSLEAYIPYGAFCHSALPSTAFPERSPVRRAHHDLESRALAAAGRKAEELLLAGPPQETALALLDDAFMSNAAGAGLLAVEACVQHGADRVATIYLYAALGLKYEADVLDEACAATMGALMGALPAHLCAALRVCVGKRTEETLLALRFEHATLGLRDADDALARLVRFRSYERTLREEREADIDAVQEWLVSVAAAESAAAAAAVQAAQAAMHAQREAAWRAHLEAATASGLVLRNSTRRLWYPTAAGEEEVAGGWLAAAASCFPGSSTTAFPAAAPAPPAASQPLAQAASAPPAVDARVRVPAAQTLALAGPEELARARLAARALASPLMQLARTASAADAVTTLLGMLVQDAFGGAAPAGAAAPVVATPPSGLQRVQSVEAHEASVLRAISSTDPVVLAAAAAGGARASYPESEEEEQ